MGNEYAFVMRLIWLLLLLVVAASDFIYRKFKNKLFIFIICLGFVFNYFEMNSYYLSFSNSFIGAFFCFFLFLGFYIFNIMGAGDVKFSFALGVWLGFSNGLVFLILTATILAMLHSIYEIFFKRKVCEFFLLFKNKGDSFSFENTTWEKPTIPYAGYMALAAIVWMMLGIQTVSLLSA